MRLTGAFLLNSSGYISEGTWSGEGQFLGFTIGRVGCADAGLLAEVAYIVDSTASTFTAEVYFAFPGADGVWYYTGSGKGERIKQ